MNKDKKYESAALGSFIGMVGIAIICVVMITINYFNSCNTPTTDTQKQTPTNFYLELDSIPDSRWEGQEGKSDEHVMWIGGDGDTIWE
tara:strand:- start:391 stop:654 length:264 start_codon:yes stop_codon:yes gene_type:complete